MYTLETKKVAGKPYLYAIRRVKLGDKKRKLSVYVGKTAPKTKLEARRIVDELYTRELALVPEIVADMQLPDLEITNAEYTKVEKERITHQYAYAGLTEKKQQSWWREFTVRFIFESNKIEGSRLSESEVSSIVLGKKTKKSSLRTEIREVENAIEAMELVRNGDFSLNERSVLKLHALITRDLGIAQGFKREENVVNNKHTVLPGEVRSALAKLTVWWKTEKNIAPFYKAVLFHQRFEHIHPFADGNGRTGRFLFLWMLINTGYGIILFHDKNRRSYFSALSKADDGQNRIWLRHAMKVYCRTISEFWKKG